MFDDIKEKIKNKKLVVFGEIHGTKEIPEMLSQFFSELAKEEDFDICLEIPTEFQNNIKGFFNICEKNIKNSDGRNSLEYFRLIQNLKKLNEKHNRNIKIFCIDMGLNILLDNKKNLQNIREEIIAKNILKSLSNKKTFAILGNVHASKKIINFPTIKIISAGSILFENLNDKMFSINFSPKKGQFFNFGIKNIFEENDESFNKNFDYTIEVDYTTPCSFLR